MSFPKSLKSSCANDCDLGAYVVEDQGVLGLDLYGWFCGVDIFIGVTLLDNEVSCGGTRES